MRSAPRPVRRKAQRRAFLPSASFPVGSLPFAGAFPFAAAACFAAVSVVSTSDTAGASDDIAGDSFAAAACAPDSDGCTLTQVAQLQGNPRSAPRVKLGNVLGNIVWAGAMPHARVRRPCYALTKKENFGRTSLWPLVNTSVRRPTHSLPQTAQIASTRAASSLVIAYETLQQSKQLTLAGVVAPAGFFPMAPFFTAAGLALACACVTDCEAECAWRAFQCDFAANKMSV